MVTDTKSGLEEAFPMSINDNGKAKFDIVSLYFIFFESLYAKLFVVDPSKDTFCSADIKIPSRISHNWWLWRIKAS
jgi:hypothetical protein